MLCSQAGHRVTTPAALGPILPDRSGCQTAEVPGVIGSRVRIAVGDVDSWCRRHFSAGVGAVLFCEGYLSTVLGVELASGQRVVVKVRPRAERLYGCAAVHERLYARGFPCPEPLLGVEPLDDELVASAEALVTGGADQPDSGRSPIPFATALARLVALAPSPHEVPSLEPRLPWTAPDLGSAQLWPAPANVDLDLNACDGWPWIDEAGRAAKRRLAESTFPAVVGHGDWYTRNLRWKEDELHVAWDWDSVIAASEAAIAGVAAVTYLFGLAGSNTEATVEESQAFLDAYQGVRGRFDGDQLAEAWAAALWNRSFNAKLRAVASGDRRLFTEAEAAEFRHHVEER